VNPSKARYWLEERYGDESSHPKPSDRPIATFVSKRAGKNLRKAFHGLLGPKFHPSHKVKLTAEFLEDKFTGRDQCDAVHDVPMEAIIHALPETMVNKPAITVRPCDVPN